MFQVRLPLVAPVPIKNCLAAKPCAARRHNLINPFFGFFDELPGSDEYPSGDASQFDSILMFLGFRNISNRRKWNSYMYGLSRIKNCRNHTREKWGKAIKKESWEVGILVGAGQNSGFPRTNVPPGVLIGTGRTDLVISLGTDIAPSGNFRLSSDSCQIKEVLECGAPGGNFRPSSDSCQIKEVLECGAPGEGHSVKRHLEEQRYQSRVALGGVKHVVFLELWLGMTSFELWLGMADEHEGLLSCGSGWRVLSV
ncbi:hypothetical protein DEO72_LG4g461 [Vigna unguiculata]|uniref:Uncharacterized protein n=1 Tax=Vigna unguiculata TaxID=3917 RepID=A0A4D6LME7_VIGUN|nr:hypothetical protein DEO72_LG4g461 [Vigna unguiculata]